MKTKLFFFLFLLYSIGFLAQESKSEEKQKKKSFFRKIYGEAPKSSIIFMPIGHHIIDPDVIFPWYIGINYKSFELSVYRNSHNSISTSLFFKRKLKLSKKLYLIGGAGLTHGYKGKLQHVRGIPFKKTLFSGSVTPVVGIELNYVISKRISINFSIVPPVVVAYGIRYAL